MYSFNPYYKTPGPQNRCVLWDGLQDLNVSDIREPRGCDGRKSPIVSSLQIKLHLGLNSYHHKECWWTWTMWEAQNKKWERGRLARRQRSRYCMAHGIIWHLKQDCGLRRRGGGGWDMARRARCSLQIRALSCSFWLVQPRPDWMLHAGVWWEYCALCVFKACPPNSHTSLSGWTSAFCTLLANCYSGNSLDTLATVSTSCIQNCLFKPNDTHSDRHLIKHDKIYKTQG